jgi:hypothetical protein
VQTLCCDSCGNHDEMNGTCSQKQNVTQARGALQGSMDTFISRDGISYFLSCWNKSDASQSSGGFLGCNVRDLKLKIVS